MKSLNAFSFTIAKVLFSLIKVLMYLLIFRFLIKKCTTLLTMYFKYKTALQPCSLTILITYFALIRLPTGTTKYVRMCQFEDCVLQSSLNHSLAIMNRSWLWTTLNFRILRKKVLKKTFLAVENGVKQIQTAGYNAEMPLGFQVRVG